MGQTGRSLKSCTGWRYGRELRSVEGVAAEPKRRASFEIPKLFFGYYTFVSVCFCVCLQTIGYFVHNNNTHILHMKKRYF